MPSVRSGRPCPAAARLRGVQSALHSRRAESLQLYRRNSLSAGAAVGYPLSGEDSPSGCTPPGGRPEEGADFCCLLDSSLYLRGCLCHLSQVCFFRVGASCDTSCVWSSGLSWAVCVRPKGRVTEDDQWATATGLSLDGLYCYL